MQGAPLCGDSPGEVAAAVSRHPGPQAIPALRAGRAAPLVVAMIAILTAMASCAHSACSLADGRGGFGIQIALPSYQPSPGDTITVCAAGACGTVDATADELFVESNVFTFNTPIDVTAKLTDATGVRVAGGTASVTPEAWYPNGPQCEPRVLSAMLVIDQRGVHQTPTNLPRSPGRST